MTPDADVRRPAGENRGSGRARRAAVLAASLFAVAFLGAATAGVLGAVGPYLVGVSALVLALFAFGWR